MATDFEEMRQQILASEDREHCPRVPVPPFKADQNYIFISYCSKNYKSVYCDLSRLYEKGVRFWYDKRLVAGEVWSDNVKERLMDPHCVGAIFYISPDSLLSSAVVQEMEWITEGVEGTQPLGYFSVNLGNKDVFQMLLELAMQFGGYDGLKKTGLGAERAAKIQTNFGGGRTYVGKSDDPADDVHISAMIEQIASRFGVIDLGFEEKPEFNTGNYQGHTKNGKREGRGTFHYADGSIYEGEWKENVRCGLGRLTVNADEWYEGEWANDAQDGHGKYVYGPDNSIEYYEGEWKNGKYGGQGKKVLKDGHIYEGLFEDGEIIQGHLTGSDIDVEGTWENGKKFTGTGWYKLVNGRYYEGSWVDGQISGKGKLTYTNGRVYEGDFAEGKWNGKGRYTVNSDQYLYYEGEVADDKFNGFGKYVYGPKNTKDYYEGEWENSKYNGQGKEVMKDGRVFEGLFKDDNIISGHLSGPNIDITGTWQQGEKVTGTGWQRCTDGKYYEGSWIDGQWGGKGKLTYPSGMIYEGDFVEGKRNGQGKEIMKDGRIFEGLFEDGSIISGHVTGPNIDIQGTWKHGEKVTGTGWQRYTDGKYYEGSWTDGQWSGKSKLTYANGRIYEGDFVEDKWNGKGRYTINSDQYLYYEGEVADNDYSGFGKFVYGPKNEIEYYEGEWRKGKYNGQGRKVFKDGRVFEGLFEDGNIISGHLTGPDVEIEGRWKRGEKVTGTGWQRCTDGKYYEGSWKDGQWEGKGKLTYPNGRVYEGDFAGGKWNGKGRFTVNNDQFLYYEGEVANDGFNGFGKYVYGPKNTKDYYEGEWKNDKYNGQGKRVMRDGRVFEGLFENNSIISGHLTGPNIEVNGHWENGQFTGIGWEKTSKGLYEGNWKNDEYNGQGKLSGKNVLQEGTFKDGEFWSGTGWEKTSNGNLFEGSWKDGKRNGKGKLTYANGAIYEGDFAEGKLSGKGRYTVNSDQYLYYEGDLKDNDFNGFGKYYYGQKNNKDYYEGEWKDGKWNGKGKLVYRKGSIYEGDFVEGKLSGKGRYTINEHSYYEGDFADNTYNGFGKFVHEPKDSQDYYYGEWKDGKRNGHAKLVNKDGTWFEGEYVEGKKNGRGVFHGLNSLVTRGEWKDDKLENGTIRVTIDGRDYAYTIRQGKFVNASLQKGIRYQ